MANLTPGAVFTEEVHKTEKQDLITADLENEIKGKLLGNTLYLKEQQEQLGREVAGKAAQADLEALAGEVGGKAETASLEALATATSKALDGRIGAKVVITADSTSPPTDTSVLWVHGGDA